MSLLRERPLEAVTRPGVGRARRPAAHRVAHRV